MPRQVLIELPGTVYHVMSRGDRREDTFFDDGDRHMFLATLAGLRMGVTTGLSRYANKAQTEIESNPGKAKLYQKIARGNAKIFS